MVWDQRLTAESGGGGGDRVVPWRVIGIFWQGRRNPLRKGKKKAPHGFAFTRVSAVDGVPRHRGANILG